MLIGALVLALEAAPRYSVDWPADAACTAGDLEGRIDDHWGPPIEGRERVEVRAAYTFAVRRGLFDEDQCALDTLEAQFEVSGGNLYDLILDIAGNPSFRVARPE